ncbi:sensor histidine kinase [Desulfosporosinus sp. FKA]|uniref:ATP-binding protein n=1 Tax=Desulfosporosinus sp. FKA TaxID=1969834 RepID=UPI000B49E474|nr:sensor histidine kinase [Desulfosporosinus sp. FKA]
MRLQRKISIYILVILSVSIGSIMILSVYQMRSLVKNQVSRNLLNISNSVANFSEVQDFLQGKSTLTENAFNEQIETIRAKTGVAFIVVMNMKGIRYSHPVETRIGEKFQGGDEKRVLTSGQEYVSEAHGTLGTSLRAFAPIYKNGHQIGAVSVGILLTELDTDVYKALLRFLPFIVFGLFLGGIGATVLSFSIKNTIFGMEPEEIALALKEREVVLGNVKEGIVAVDDKGKITLYNKQAAIILDLNESDKGKNVFEFIFRDVQQGPLSLGQLLEDVEIRIKPGLTIVCKYSPLIDEKNRVMGAVINFRDLTTVKKMAEELTGIKKMAWSLRAQNHEFMNKLHTISALIQMEEYDEAVDYISSTAKARNNVSGILTRKIKNVSVSALLFAKYNKAEESRIKLKIDPNCSLSELPQALTADDLCSVLGNLIENAFDAVESDGSGEVYVKLDEEDDILNITVADNGSGIPESVQPYIYNLGMSSKSGQRGYGMYIVKKIIDDARGTIRFKVDRGTSWHISVPLKGRDINV